MNSYEEITTFTDDGQIIQLPNLEPSNYHLRCPIFIVQNSAVALGPKLQEQNSDKVNIGIVRGLDQVLNLDLQLFSSSKLSAVDPNSNVDIRMQYYQHGAINLNRNGESTWEYYSKGKSSTIKEYAEYQQSIEQQRQSGVNAKPGSIIKFATNVDLSGIIWQAQFDEVQKLPPFAQISSKSNFLSYLGHEVLGMNTLQVFMKVPGVRTPAHKENLNLCSVNVNVGPGDCEWFAISEKHWPTVLKLCKENRLNFLKSPWWPDLDDLEAHNIPYYRFIQKPGDLVWVNIGCIHWVQGVDRICNNFAYNVGPVSIKQYEYALQSFEYNQKEKFKSILPMSRLSWNFARDYEDILNSQTLLKHVRRFLVKSLVENNQTLEILGQRKVKKSVHDPRPNLPSIIFCYKCEIEIFNILLISARSTKSHPKIYCIKCTLQKNQKLKGIQFFEEFPEDELWRILLRTMD